MPHWRAVHLDRLLPDHDVHEVHSILVRAHPLAVHRALFEVTANEVWLFRALMTLRGLGARGSDGSRPHRGGRRRAVSRSSPKSPAASSSSA